MLGKSYNIGIIFTYDGSQVLVIVRNMFTLTIIDIYWTNGRAKINVSWWQLLGGSIRLKNPHSSCGVVAQTALFIGTLGCVVVQRALLIFMGSIFNTWNCNLQKELLMSSWLSYWRLFSWTVKEVGQVVDAQLQRFLDFIRVQHDKQNALTYFGVLLIHVEMASIYRLILIFFHASPKVCI